MSETWQIPCFLIHKLAQCGSSNKKYKQIISLNSCWLQTGYLFLFLISYVCNSTEADSWLVKLENESSGLNSKSSESKVKFRQASNHCNRVLEATKLAYANKTKDSITYPKLGFWDFWENANSILNKGKSAIPPLFNKLEVLCSASDKAKLFAENLLIMACWFQCWKNSVGFVWLV